MTSVKDDVENPTEGAEDTPVQLGADGRGKGSEGAPAHGGHAVSKSEKMAALQSGGGNAAPGERPGAHVAVDSSKGAAGFVEASSKANVGVVGLEAINKGAAGAAVHAGGSSSNDAMGIGAIESIKKSVEGAAGSSVGDITGGLAGGIGGVFGGSGGGMAAGGVPGATPGFVPGGAVPSIAMGEGDAGGVGGGALGGFSGLEGVLGGVAGTVAGGVLGEVAGGVVGGIAGGGIAGGIAGGSAGGDIGKIAGGVVGGIAGAGISGVVGAIGGNVAESVAGSIGSLAGGVVGGIAGSVVSSIAGSAISGGAGAGKVGGIAAGDELPIFEEKAITSSMGGKAAASFVGSGLPSKAAGVLGSLSGKTLEVEIASDDPLDVRQFSIHERMSSPFQVNLIVVSENPSIDFDAVVGQPARFALNAGTHNRLWAGICNNFEQVRIEPSGLSTYQISIVPPLWLLTQRKNYRMFQQISEPDIVLKILKEWNIEPEVRIDKGAYKKRKYRVQYAESDFAFISRMLEDAGVTYYFEQIGDETKMVLSDAPQSNPKRAMPLTFLDDTSMVQKIEIEFVTGVRISQRVRPGKYTMRDHDYRRPPSFKLMSSAAGGKGVEEKLERYHYTPGAFLFGTDQGDPTPSADDKGRARTDEKEAAILAQKRLDAKRGSARLCAFDTNAHDLAPGVVMNIVGHQNAALSESKTLLIIQSSLSGTDRGEWSHACEARGTEVPFRPEVVTPKPKVNGVESATVVGPPGEEIHTDEFGRVRIHFHWDRESKMDDNSSCWIHVSQSWGGAGYGGTNLPRIGQEVLVDFLGGDPDRPVIVGRVYTNLQKTPYKLPDNKTQSGWKSNSTGGGGGYNEVMFEDAQGKELLNIQAQKDLKKLVKNDESVTIGNNRTKLVKANDSLTVGANRTHRVQLNEQISIGMNQKVSIGINRATNVGCIDSTTVGDTHVVTIVPPGEGGGGGGNTTTLMQNQKIVLDTGGGASITLDGSTITISGSVVLVEAKAFLGAYSGVSTVVGGVANLTLGSTVATVVSGGVMTSVGSGGIMNVSSSGDLSINGALVKINGPGLFAARITDTAPDKVTRGSATVHIGGPFGYTAPPTLEQILEDPAFTSALEAAWNESNPNAPDVPKGQPGSQKQEQGGWVVWNKDTGQLEVQRVPAGTRDGLGTIVGTRPADNSQQQVVGWFHTHPNTSTEGYTSGPSPGDIGWQNNEGKAPGIIMTHDGVKTIPYP